MFGVLLGNAQITGTSDFQIDLPAGARDSGHTARTTHLVDTLHEQMQRQPESKERPPSVDEATWAQMGPEVRNVVHGMWQERQKAEQLAEERAEEARKEGCKEGEEKGRKEGRKEGEEKGRKEGRKEGHPARGDVDGTQPTRRGRSRSTSHRGWKP